MSTSIPDPQSNPGELAEATMAFMQAFEGLIRRASANAGESAPRLRLLNELHCNGPRKMADLADALGVTPRAVTALVDSLEAESLVQRSAHPTDRRITMVEITGGSGTVEKQFSAFQDTMARLFGDLSGADRVVYARVLGELETKIKTTF